MSKFKILICLVILAWLLARQVTSLSEGFQVVIEKAGTDTESSVSVGTDFSGPSFEALTEAIIQVESDGRPRLVGPCKERGLMQVPRRTWNWICKTQLKVKWDFDRYAFDPEKNVAVGRAELRYLLKRLNNDWEAAVMAYNCGLRKYRIGKAPRRTYRYLDRVKKELARLSSA